MASRFAHQRIELVVTMAALVFGILLGGAAVVLVRIADPSPPAQVTADPTNVTVPQEADTVKSATEQVAERTTVRPVAIETRLADRIAITEPTPSTTIPDQPEPVEVAAAEPAPVAPPPTTITEPSASVELSAPPPPAPPVSEAPVEVAPPPTEPPATTQPASTEPPPPTEPEPVPPVEPLPPVEPVEPDPEPLPPVEPDPEPLPPVEPVPEPVPPVDDGDDDDDDDRPRGRDLIEAIFECVRSGGYIDREFNCVLP